MARSPSPESGRIVYMTMTYSPYSIPVFDLLHERLGDRFMVLSREATESDDPTKLLHNYEAATRLGAFPRCFVKQRQLPLRLESWQGKRRVGRVAVAPSLPRLLRSLEPACVVSPNFNTWSLTSLLMGYPTVLFWEGWSHTEQAIGPARTWLRRRMAKRAAGLLAQGRLSKDYLATQLGVPAAPIQTPGLCPVPPPLELREEARRRRKQLNKVRFLCVARLVRGKGIDHLLRATAWLKEIARDTHPFEVVIAGDGPQRSRIEAIVRELGIEDHVRLLGYVPTSEIWRQYAEADVFILPTLKDYWALSVAEAMSMAMPVLVSRFAGSYADLVQEGENGFSFEPAAHSALSSIMLKYLKDPSLASLHGERSLERIAPYTPDAVADAIQAAIGRARQKEARPRLPILTGEHT